MVRNYDSRQDARHRSRREHSRYVSSVFDIGLPWPMTPDRGALLLAVPLIVVLGGGTLVTWAAIAFIEPSLWRMAPPIAWLLLSRTIIHLIVQLFRPKDVDQRWAELRRSTAQLNAQPSTQS